MCVCCLRVFCSLEVFKEVESIREKGFFFFDLDMGGENRGGMSFR